MWKGSKHTKESREKIGKSKIGKKRLLFSEEWRKNMSLSKKGKPRDMTKMHSPESRQKARLGISKALKGKKKSPEHIQNMIKAFKGRPSPNKGKSSWWMIGEKSMHWKGGITPINKKIRESLEYKLWRKSVFERDGYACLWCGIKNGGGKTIKLNADHIKPFALYPELRFALENGRTLCIDCHRKTETFGRREIYNNN